MSKYLLIIGLLFTCAAKAQTERPLPKCNCREIDSLRVIVDSLWTVSMKYFDLRVMTIGVKWPKELRDAADLADYRWKESFMKLIAAEGGTWKYSNWWDGADFTEPTCENECKQQQKK